MNKIVSLPIAAGIVPMLPSRAASSSVEAPPHAALEAYAAWLHMERRILCHELWPHMGSAAEHFVWADNAGYNWHFTGRGNLKWNEGQQPSARAAAVLDLVGVNWREEKEDLGLDHSDNSERPALPAQWPYVDGDLMQASCNVSICQLAIRGAQAAPETLEAIWDSREESLNILCNSPATSWSGLSAKASALEDVGSAGDEWFEKLALSLANDISRVMPMTAPPKQEA